MEINFDKFTSKPEVDFNTAISSEVPVGFNRIVEDFGSGCEIVFASSIWKEGRQDKGNVVDALDNLCHILEMFKDDVNVCISSMTSLLWDIMTRRYTCCHLPDNYVYNNYDFRYMESLLPTDKVVLRLYELINCQSGEIRNFLIH